MWDFPDGIVEIFRGGVRDIRHTDRMARQWGPTAETVKENLNRLRTDARLSLRELANKMADGPGKLTHSSIGEIERGERRVDADELTALAVALDVSPVTLLMPRADEPYSQDVEVRLSGTGYVYAGVLLDWLRGDGPLDADVQTSPAEQTYFATAHRRRALPNWAWTWGDKGTSHG